MILQALNRYYDILASDPQSGIAPPGYSLSNVSFALNLSPDGELLNIFPLFDTVQRGKQTKEVPRRMLVPEHIKRSSGIAPNFLCDNPAYVLGLSDKDAADPEYALKRFEAFRQWNKLILADAECPEARAVIAFLDNYDPSHGREHPVIAAQLERILESGNLLFRLSTAGFVHEAAEIRRVWHSQQAPDGTEVVGQCLVTGEKAPIARLHPSLKGIKDANPTGATLVGFNARAYESYNRTGGQGLNSPVSEKATFAYATALNYLLSRENKNPKFTIGDTTVVYWAESKDQNYAAVFSSLFGAGYAETEGAETAPGRENQDEQRLKEIAEKIRRAQGLDAGRLMEGLDPNTRFYVLGLAPNAARISVRFFHTDPFQKMVEKIMAHYTDLSIEKQFENQPDLIPVWQILQETV
jgi:CRISPR-associated protein Csd1